MQCDICGRWGHETPLVGIGVCTGDVIMVCRSWHFEGKTVDAHTGMTTHLHGPKPLDALVWFPEGYVPSMKYGLWNKED